MGSFVESRFSMALLLLLGLACLAGCSGSDRADDREGGLDDDDSGSGPGPTQDDDEVDDDDDDDLNIEPNSDYQEEALVMNLQWDVYHHSPILLAVDADRVAYIGGEWDDGSISLHGQSLPLVPLQMIELTPGRNKILYQNGQYSEELLVWFQDDLSAHSGGVVSVGKGKDEEVEFFCADGACVPEVLILKNTGDKSLAGVQVRGPDDAPLRTAEEFADRLPDGSNLSDMARENMRIVRKHLIGSEPSWSGADAQNGYGFPDHFRDDGLDFCSGMSVALARLFWMEGLDPAVGQVMQQPVFGHVTMALIDDRGSHWMDPYYCLWGDDNGDVASFQQVAFDPEGFILPWADPAGEGPCGSSLDELVSAVREGAAFAPGPVIDFSILDGVEGGFQIGPGHTLTLIPNETGKAFRICSEGDPETCIRFPDEESMGSFVDSWAVDELGDIACPQTYPLHGAIISGFDQEMIGRKISGKLAFVEGVDGEAIETVVLPDGTINLSKYFMHSLERGIIRYFRLQLEDAPKGNFEIHAIGQFARRNWPTSNRVLVESSDNGLLEVSALIDQNVGSVEGAVAYWRHEGYQEAGPSVLELPANGKSFAAIEVAVLSSLEEEYMRRVPGIYTEAVAGSASLSLTPPSLLYHETREAVPTAWTGTLRFMSQNGVVVPWQVRCLAPGGGEIEIFVDDRSIQTLNVVCGE